MPKKTKYYNLSKDMRITESGKLQYRLCSYCDWRTASGSLKDSKMFKKVKETYGTKEGAKVRDVARAVIIKSMSWSI